MKNLYLVQVDVSACTGAEQAYLPYTAGVLAANAFLNETVKENYCFKEFVFLREDADEVISRMEEPAVAGFSNYCWNTEYNKLLASKIKKKWPECLIVFGGHNVPETEEFLNEIPFIDILCHGEGEETFRDVLIAALSGEFSAVNNISYRDGDKIISNQRTAPGEIANYPSPYIDGWFDDIVANHPEITFNAILETSRGCPHRCAYCDWGLLKSKTRIFPMERILAEIKWMSAHKIAFVWGADANFGLFDRDVEIAQALIDAKESTGYPERMRMNYSKTNFENVFTIVKKFKECEFDRIGATLSFQSLSPEVLHNIGRKNMSLDFFKNLLTRYNQNGMKAYSELILGLPGETYESFIRGIGQLFEIGQHYVFEVYSCILLPNSIMGQKDFIEQFGIKTVRSEILRPHFATEAFAVPEYNNIIVETNSMSREMWIRSTVFYYFTKAFHGNGLLRAFAIWLHYEKNIPYECFYDGIIDYFENNPELYISQMYKEIRQHADEISRGINNKKLLFEPSGDVVWDDHEYIVLNFLSEKEQFFADMLPYLKSFDIPEDIFTDLLEYQKNILRVPCEESAEINLGYDIHCYLQSVYVNEHMPLKKLNHTLKLTDTDVMSNWRDFGKFVIWYGRMGWKSYKDSTEIIEK